MQPDPSPRLACRSRRRSFWSALLPCLAVGCGAPPLEPTGEVESSGHALTAAAAEDGLAEAYAVFKNLFVSFALDAQYRIGFGFHPGLSTERLANAQGHLPKGTAVLDFAAKRVTATLDDAPASGSFDLFFVKNVAGSGRTVRPESGDQFLKVGSFTTSGAHRSLDVVLAGSSIDFDLDLVVVTRKGQTPSASRIALGARTLFEKRFFRERAGKTLDPPGTPVANNIETTDKLVARGAQLFFKETFGGNGRTCGTCHRAERNLTIDAAFIATLPQTDPLFVAENQPALANLEKPALMRQRGLILENVDGFENPTGKFVMRSVNHTFALGQTNGMLAGLGSFPFVPPDHRLGWGGDGGPGRSTLHEFGFGAIIQHFTKDLARRPGTDFRIPTQEELDALEAFQLFTGRQKLTSATGLTLRDPGAQSGKQLFFNQASCTVCHGDLLASPTSGSFNTGVAALASDLPADDGFLDTSISGNRFTFNVPPVLEAADSPPFFHNNSVADIEGVVAFYASPAFRSAPDGFIIDLTTTQQADVAAFLRVVNAAENMRQVRKRAQFVRANRSTGNTELLAIAIADTKDAINVLAARNLNLAARNELADVRDTLQIAQANPDANRPAFMDHALIMLEMARAELFTANPDNEF
jgi:mono/diheme cytochrome c family protein